MTSDSTGSERLCDGYEWRGEVPWRCTLPVGHKRDGVFLGRSCQGSHYEPNPMHPKDAADLEAAEREALT